MNRNKKIAVISHCVLNQNSVVYDLARCGGAMKKLVKYLVDNDYAIYQLPCPELMYGGMTRPQKSYAEYATPQFIDLCTKTAITVANELRKLMKDGCSIEKIIGINKSPSCSVFGFRGHFIQALQEQLPELATANWLDVPKDYNGNDEPEWLKY